MEIIEFSGGEDGDEERTGRLNVGGGDGSNDDVEMASAEEPKKILSRAEKEAIFLSRNQFKKRVRAKSLSKRRKRN